MNTVENDLARFQQQQVQDDAREDWLELTAANLYIDWRRELEKEKIIKDLGYEQADINALADIRNQQEKGSLKWTADDALQALAYQWVVDHENDFLNKSVGWK